MHRGSRVRIHSARGSRRGGHHDAKTARLGHGLGPGLLERRRAHVLGREALLRGKGGGGGKRKKGPQEEAPPFFSWIFCWRRACAKEKRTTKQPCVTGTPRPRRAHAPRAGGTGPALGPPPMDPTLPCGGGSCRLSGPRSCSFHLLIHRPAGGSPLRGRACVSAGPPLAAPSPPCPPARKRDLHPRPQERVLLAVGQPDLLSLLLARREKKKREGPYHATLASLLRPKGEAPRPGMVVAHMGVRRLKLVPPMEAGHPKVLVKGRRLMVFCFQVVGQQAEREAKEAGGDGDVRRHR